MMDEPLAIGGLVFAVVFGGALLGMFLARVLPKHHLSAERWRVRNIK